VEGANVEGAQPDPDVLSTLTVEEKDKVIENFNW
jgi:hypothetical protein